MGYRFRPGDPGNFEGKAQVQVFAMIRAAGAIAAAVGPLLGWLLTTLLSWRVGVFLEAVIIAGVLLGTGLIRDVPYTGDRSVDVVGSILSVLGMSLLVLGVLAWHEGGESVAALLLAGTIFSVARVRWTAGRRCDLPDRFPLSDWLRLPASMPMRRLLWAADPQRRVHAITAVAGTPAGRDG
jgi:MFS family permease